MNIQTDIPCIQSRLYSLQFYKQVFVKNYTKMNRRHSNTKKNIPILADGSTDILVQEQELVYLRYVDSSGQAQTILSNITYDVVFYNPHWLIQPRDLKDI